MEIERKDGKIVSDNVNQCQHVDRVLRIQVKLEV